MGKKYKEKRTDRIANNIKKYGRFGGFLYIIKSREGIYISLSYSTITPKEIQ